MCKVIALANQKGGVAKTTTTVNLGIALARAGKRVLLIDNDPQGNLTQALGFQENDELDITLSTMLEHVLNEERFPLSKGIIHHEEGVDFMPANIELSGVEISLVLMGGTEEILKDYIELVSSNYDYVLIDCSPNLGRLTLSALVAADEVIIPVQAAYYSLKGLEQLLKTIRRVKRKLNKKLQIAGILITMVDYRTNYAKDITEVIYNVYGGSLHIFENCIPFAVKVAETSGYGVSVFEHDKRGNATKAYEELAREVIANG